MKDLKTFSYRYEVILTPGGLTKIARTVGEWETHVFKTGCVVFSFEIHCSVSVNITLLLSSATQGSNARKSQNLLER